MPIAKPTSYQGLRYEEDWTFLRQNSDNDPWRRLKFIPLGDDGKIYLSMGGQARFRTERWANFSFGGPGRRDDTFGLWRVRLHQDLHVGQSFRFFVEAKSALLGPDRQLPGGRRTSDVDTVDLQNAFIDLRIPFGGNTTLTLRPGRQELAFGRERLVGIADWTNTRKTFDGVRGIAKLGWWRVDTFWARPVRIKKYAFNGNSTDTNFFGAYAVGKIPTTNLVLDVYWLGLDRSNSALGSFVAKENRHTIGARTGGKISNSDFDFDVESARQFGSFGDRDISAGMFASVLGYHFSKVAGAPRAYVGFDYASGGNPAGEKIRTYNQLFPSAHPYFGFIDAIGRQNISDLSEGLSLKPMRRLEVGLDGHVFRRASAQDALYDPGGNVLRKGSLGLSKNVGSEIDLMLKYAIDAHTVVTTGFSHLFAGDFIKESGSARGIDFAYLALQYTF
ncbi:MAG TPA: alginate export family protein [Acidobacteriota bacterium]